MAQRTDIICLQEMNVSGRDRISLANHAKHSGYMPFFAHADMDKVAWTCILVRRTRRATCVATWEHGEGELITLDLDSCMLVNIFGHPTVPDGGQLRDEIARISGADGKRRHFIVARDWNRTPEEAEQIDMVKGATPMYAATPSGSAIPTRWPGKRCIDWVLTTDRTRIFDMWLDEEKWSDHKLLHFRIQYTREEEARWEPIPTCSYRRPHYITLDVWRAAIAKQWRAATLGITVRTNAAVDFRRFSELAEAKFAAAMDDLGLERGRPPQHRARGSRFEVQQETAKVDRNRQRCPFRVRKLRRTLGRLLELKRHIRLRGEGGDEPRDVVRLRQHIADTHIEGFVLSGTVEEVVAATTVALGTFCSKAREDRLN